MEQQTTEVAIESNTKSESPDKSAPIEVSEPVNQQKLAYELWQARGCPDGSPEVDWFMAEELQRLGIKTPSRTS